MEESTCCYSELYASKINEVEERRVFEETQEHVRAVQERVTLGLREHDLEKDSQLSYQERIQHRQNMYVQIKEIIQVFEGFILNNELLKADEDVLEMDNIFGEFVSFGPSACQDLSRHLRVRTLVVNLVWIR